MFCTVDRKSVYGVQWDAQQLVRVSTGILEREEGCYTWGYLWHLLELLTPVGQGLLSVFLSKDSLHVLHQKPAAGWCRQVPSQVFAAGAVHASVSTLLHSVRLWSHTGLISNCKEVNVAHRESGIKISKAGAFQGLSGAWCCSCCTGDVNWG